jgi:hypothetical protein
MKVRSGPQRRNIGTLDASITSIKKIKRSGQWCKAPNGDEAHHSR